MRSRRIARRFLGKMRLRVVIVLAIGLLILITVLLVTRHQRLSVSESEYVRVYMGQNLAGRLDRAWLDTLPSKRLLPLEDGTEVSCVELKDALSSLDAQMTVYEHLHVESPSRALVLPGEDILADNTAYLIYYVDGKPLTAEQGGPFRLMVLEGGGGYDEVMDVRTITVRFIEE